MYCFLYGLCVNKFICIFLIGAYKVHFFVPLTFAVLMVEWIQWSSGQNLSVPQYSYNPGQFARCSSLPLLFQWFSPLCIIGYLKSQVLLNPPTGYCTLTNTLNAIYFVYCTNVFINCMVQTLFPQMILDYSNSSSQGAEFFDMLVNRTSYRTLFVPEDGSFDNNVVSRMKNIL